MGGICFKCGQQSTSEQSFCGVCGAPLSLSSYVAWQVDARLAEAPRDRDTWETESAIRIFEKAYGWAKLVGGITTGLVAVLIAGGAYESLNLRRTVSDTLAAVSTAKSSAEKQISDTASVTSSEMVTQSMKSMEVIRAAAKSVDESSRQTQTAARSQRSAISQQANQVRRDFESQATAVTKDVASARQQIQSANELQPQMALLQQQLLAAQDDIKKQQQTITSSEEFAKKIFSSHKFFSFDIKTADKTSYGIISSTQNGKPVRVLYLLLPSAAVTETLQLQFSTMIAAPNSFSTFHNLFVVYVDPAMEQFFLQTPIQVGYFPDPSDKVRISTLAVKDGRIFADGEALPKFPGIDADFKGSKWFPPAPLPTSGTPKLAP